ncbi:MAG: Hpt domain-containing protein [Gammaproteobacteria bacterium]|nr:Hpt domain-containing protein [Gammaproteobacteria bacterium]
MAQVRTLDGNILNWVKAEIDTTMAQARQALETFVETPSDQSQLQFCLNYLHQVHGTLQMVELYGAAMLAEELERSTQAIIDKRVANREDAYEVLMRGMLRLPDYLEKLQAGQADYPIILLPLLNDLRAVRNAGLLTESALFSPNLEVDAPIPLERAEQPIDTLARKLRHAYHLGLLDWFRGHDINSGLNKIGTVIEKLRKSANEPDASRMLWAASGVIEALQDHGIDSSVAVKMLLGQVDRHVKKLIDKGEFALSNEPPLDLLKNLLYYVASSSSDGTRVTEIKDAFHLATVMPDKETLTRARADLTAPNAALMKTVSAVMIDDLMAVKDSLDVFMRNPDRQPIMLKGMVEKLGQMADTLGMLGFGDQRHILVEQLVVLRELFEGKRAISEAELMNVASALLTIENVLTEPRITTTSRQLQPDAEDKTAQQLLDPEKRKLIKRVVDEAKVDLSVIKDAFNEYGRAPKQIQLLKDVPELLDRIRGSLSMLSLGRAANILKSAAGYIQGKILNTQLRPDTRSLELLADSISSVEYYLESLVESWGHPISILEVAEQSLLDLGITRLEGETVTTTTKAREKQPTVADQTLVDLAQTGEPDDAQDVTQQMDISALAEADLETASTQDTGDSSMIDIRGFDNLAQLNRADDIKEPEVEGSISQEFNLPRNNPTANSPTTTPAKPAAPPPIAVVTQNSTLADELDDEIVEIFLEEADEEHANISRLLPAWYNNPESTTALKELRRSFHTLKGSGRLVGAVDVGEFAWAFENMLNRVIDHTVQHSPQMFELLGTARDQLPGLLQLFRSGGKPGQEIFNLMSRVDAISQGKTTAVKVPKAPTNLVSPVSPPPPVEPPLATSPSLAPNVGELESDDLELTPWDDDQPTVTQEIGSHPGLQFARDAPPLAVPEATDTPELSLDEVASVINIDLDAVPESSLNEQFDLAAAAFDLSAELLDSTEIIPIPAPAIDPVLLDIYRKEIDAHIENIHEYIDGWYAGQDRSANSKLKRALHTIKGSSRTADVPEIADLFGPLEDHVRLLEDETISVDADFISLLQECEQYIQTTVKLLDVPGAVLPDNSRLLARAEALMVIPSIIPDIQIPPSQPAPQTPAAVTTTSGQTAARTLLNESGPDLDRTPDYDMELLEIFLEEGVDILNDSDHTLHAWMNELDNKEHLRALQRQLHTLKGGARMAGVTEIGDLSHSIETMLTAVVEQDLTVNPQMLQVLQKAQDRLVGMLDIVRGNQVPKAALQLIHIINELAIGHAVDDDFFKETPVAAESAAAGGPDDIVMEVDISLDGLPSQPIIQPLPELESVEPESAPTVEMAFDTPLEVADTVSHEFAALAPEPATEVATITEAGGLHRPRGEQVRVRADLLDNLVNFAGEVSIYRSRMEQQNNAFRFNIKELDDTVTRLREQLRKFEIETETQIQYRYEDSVQKNPDFDPLEFDRFTQMQTLSRGMLESLNDLNSLRGILTNLTRESETLLLQQSRVNTELQEGLMRTRMVPIAGQVPRLRRIVRQAADELHKRAELEILGTDTELDRTVLERVMSPIEHMLRNAIAHGIESSEERRARGKPESGKIKLSFARESSDIVISVSDDGAGINLEAIRSKAMERGLIKPGVSVSKDDLIEFILESGFSTAETVTQIAGRGVGMDVVNSEIKQLGGHLEIKTEPGKGASFRISMPLSLSVVRALMIHVSENNYAIPLIGVESVERVPREEILRLQNDPQASYKWLDNDYRYIHLSSMLGLTGLQPPGEEQRRIPLLLVRAGEHRAAVHVDGLIGSREIVVKPVGPQLSALRGIAGATIMGDGSVVLILDLGVLIRAAAVEYAVANEPSLISTVAEEAEKHVPLVMVVDDSITVRKVTTRFLERNNFHTISAKDGVDALTQLQEHKPDIMLLDVEMPRMDGFELATNIRNDAVLNRLPIIMITSRTGQKHRDRALSIGVNIYMGKPYSEAELLDNINKLLSL